MRLFRLSLLLLTGLNLGFGGTLDLLSLALNFLGHLTVLLALWNSEQALLVSRL